jgi:Flp pilus assembly protein TadD
MRKPDPSTLQFSLIAVFTLAIAAAGLAALWPGALEAARHQSARLAAEGGRGSGGEAEADYQLATWLDPANQAAFAGLARAQILNGHADNALTSLGRAGEGSQVEQLKIRALVEIGRYNEAADIAATLITTDPSDQNLVLAALSFALAGRSADTQPLIPRLSSPEAAQRVRRAQGDNITLAAELYATGLLQSSSALLTKLPSSYERDLLLGRVRYARHGPGDLAQAESYLTVAVALNPASIEARQLLAAVYRDDNRPADAGRQTAAVAKLQSGRP